jgi:hypothetical protein
MNTITPTSGPQIVRLPGDRAAIAGTLAQIGPILNRLRASGILLAASNPVPDGRPGHVIVTVRLAPAQRIAAPAARPRRRTRRAVIAAGAVTALAVLAAGLWAVLTVTAWVAAHTAAILGGLVVLALVLVAVGPRVCHTVITVTHRH